MSDHDAYMLLAMSNEQSGMTPLEWGVHVLGYVQLANGNGRGQKGGLSEYAKQVGRNKGDLSSHRKAAQVVQAIQKCLDIQTLLDKAYHLYHISKTDESLWPLLCQYLIDDEWSAADTKAVVAQVKKFDIPYRWTAINAGKHPLRKLACMM